MGLLPLTPPAPCLAAPCGGTPGLTSTVLPAAPGAQRTSNRDAAPCNTTARPRSVDSVRSHNDAAAHALHPRNYALRGELPSLLLSAAPAPAPAPRLVAHMSHAGSASVPLPLPVLSNEHWPQRHVPPPASTSFTSPLMGVGTSMDPTLGSCGSSCRPRVGVLGAAVVSQSNRRRTCTTQKSALLPLRCVQYCTLEPYVRCERPTYSHSAPHVCKCWVRAGEQACVSVGRSWCADVAAKIARVARQRDEKNSYHRKSYGRRKSAACLTKRERQPL